MFSKQFFLACCCFFAIRLNGQDNSSNENISSRWTDQTITVDGKTTEWTDNNFIKGDKDGISYIIANDSVNLYICLVVRDEITKTKFLNAGFSLFLNNEGKKKKSISIDYPMQNEGNNVANDPSRLRDLKSLQLMSFISDRTYELSGFKRGDGTYTVGANNDADVKVALGISDSSDIVYETLIPFSAIFKKPPYFENNIATCFSINALTRPSFPSSSAPTTTTPVGGNINPAGGRRFATANTNPTAPKNLGQMERLFESSKTWKIVTLSKGKQ